MAETTTEYFPPRFVKLPPEEIYIVGDNPNTMTALEMQSLEYSIDNLEMVKPLLIDQNNQLVDGHQRLAVLKKKGVKEIQCIQKFVKDKKERHLLIQAMNKIHGEHDPELDAKMFKAIMDDNPDNMLALLAVTMEEDERNMQNFINKYNPDLSSMNDDQQEQEEYHGYGEVVDKEGRIVDANPVSRHAETYLHGNIKQLMIYFTNEEYQEYVSRLRKFMENENISSHTDMFKILIDTYDKHVFSRDNTSAG
jgi:hypothetical protein